MTDSKKVMAGKLVIISGPSGAGKSTVLVKVFRDSHLPLQWSVSATTRAPRPGEKMVKIITIFRTSSFKKNVSKANSLSASRFTVAATGMAPSKARLPLGSRPGIG